MRDYLSLIVSFFKIGILTFGGGYAMLPMIQREVVEKRGWATEQEILDYYAIGQCTPGVIAVNTATFIGNKVKGISGGFLATFGVVLPSLIIISVIAAVLTSFSDNAYVQHALSGIRVSVVVLVFYSVLKLHKNAVKDGFGWIIFVLGFLLSVVFGISPVYIVVGCGAAGVVRGILRKKKEGDA